LKKPNPTKWYFIVIAASLLITMLALRISREAELDGNLVGAVEEVQTEPTDSMMSLPDMMEATEIEHDSIAYTATEAGGIAFASKSETSKSETSKSETSG